MPPADHEPKPVAPAPKATTSSAAAPVESAKRATRGAGRRLPFLDRIQASFGHHDVSQVRSHDDEDARTGAAELGARAFAVGDAVAFAEAPDLHTAAHEAAHVVQQRAGHAPSGGLDTPGDALERHADAVADAVVAGRSAVALLDQFAGGTSTVAVQRKAAPQTTPQFATANRVKLLTAIADHIKNEGAFQLPASLQPDKGRISPGDLLDHYERDAVAKSLFSKRETNVRRCTTRC